MNKLTNPRTIRRFILLLATVYMVSYLTRINFGAVILEMARNTGFEKSRLSFAVTGAFITYGAGQLLSGFLGDRMQPRTLVLLGLLVSAAMNALIPFCPTPETMTILWCVNGFAQAFLWPPLVRLMACLFSDADYLRANVMVQFGASAGTILLYLIVPLLVSLSGWRSVFWFSATCGLLMSAVWFHGCIRLDKIPGGAAQHRCSVAKSLLTPMMFALMMAVLLAGALRDGVTTWMPSYIGETYHLGSDIAILTGVAMPLFGVACQAFASWLYRRFPSPPFTSLLLCCTGLVATGILLLAAGKNAAFSVLGAALLSGAMYGVNMILIGMTPAYFRDTGNVSTISGILNACVYIGSALSTYGFSRLSEIAGWNAVTLLWLGLSVICVLLCLVCTPLWKRRFPQT